MMKRIIVSGRSGSGKTVALRALEDQGFYCVDNIPIKLIPALLEQVESHYPGLALGIDARNVTHTVEEFDALIQQIEQSQYHFEVVFIDANDATLLKRFSETRRRHPMTVEGLSLSEAIEQEKKRLEPISRYAELVIDTTSKSPHELCEVVIERVLGNKSSRLSLLFVSFGFKYGAPNDADFVFDARCLPNPYWDESLRPFSGKDQAIIEYLENQPAVQEYYWQLKVFLQTWIPKFEQDNRNYLTVAIGCTGGHHRSVYVAEKLAKNFSPVYPEIQIRHRELDKH
ncbi:RNase adapter RapZ [Aliikangiella sp. G2MR2-5]|uniref:RNase adapter RapZ n=1 Tax=Aliikangiella sp. G2MR2-5 TaxID=2788943 RepID=UPI001FEE4DED|nr:RNase adapter RapZ [Aliikangiella sp. G2MR2-5]